MSERPGFFFLACADAALLRQNVHDIFSQYGFGGAQAERHVFWGDEELPDRFWELLTLQGFVTSCRGLVIRRANAMPLETWKRISKTLSRPNSHVLPVLCLEGAWEKGKPKLPAFLEKLACLRHARDQRWFVSVAKLSGRSLRDFIRNRVRQEGLEYTAETLDVLCTVLPPDAAVIEAEIAKLALYIAGCRVSEDAPLVLEPADVALISLAPDFNIFTFIQELQTGNIASVWSMVLRHTDKTDDLLFQLLGLMQREARLMWQILANDTDHLIPRDISSRRTISRRLGLLGLARLWDSLHKAEFAVKTGKCTPSQALDALIGELTLLFSTNTT